MGNILQRFMSSMTGCNVDRRILMLGLDGAGKSTIVMKLKFGEVVHTVPTIGFGVETIEYKKLKFNIWDIGGQDKIRALWKHYFAGSNAIIFVIDSSDRKRIQLAHKELHSLLADEELADCPLLILANKQDMGIMSVAEIVDKLDLGSLKGREWHAQGCSAINGHGLFEGFEWLSKVFNKKK